MNKLYSDSHSQLLCPHCQTNHPQYLQLPCQHTFCLLCTAFIYIKTTISAFDSSHIQCPTCNRISQLDPSCIQIIKKTLKEEVIPSLQEEQKKPNFPINTAEKYQFIQTVNRNLKPKENSFEDVTPETAKYFFSKSENSSKKSKLYCQHHLKDEIAYLCLTCNASMLCVKCISSSKKHGGHDIKNLDRAIEIIKEQLDMRRMDLMYRVGEMQMCEKKLEDKYRILEQKEEKTKKDIILGFEELMKKLKAKEKQILKACQKHFEYLHKNLVKENQKINYSLNILNSQIAHLISIQKQTKNTTFLLNYQQFLKFNQFFSHQSPSLSKLACPSTSIYTSIAELSEKIASLKVQYNQNDSQLFIDRFHDENLFQERRTKTNLGSLNSSRDNKKERKWTRTQEDERKRKKKGLSYKSAKKSSAKVPAYINDFINKKACKWGSGGSSAIEFGSGSTSNLKMVSKLSKVSAPEEFKKKKEQTLVKERIERKTVQYPNFSMEKPSCIKKKKY